MPSGPFFVPGVREENAGAPGPLQAPFFCFSVILEKTAVFLSAPPIGSQFRFPAHDAANPMNYGGKSPLFPSFYFRRI
jgi:hypothetical protein